jgi:FkbM family methyltransferase
MAAPIKKFKYIHQSAWIESFYDYLKFKEKPGYLVEIGVGHLIDYPRRDELYRRGIKHLPEIYNRVGSNSIELIEMGWNGLFVDPIVEFLNQCKILLPDHLARLTLVNNAASDENETLIMGDGESCINNSFLLDQAFYYRRAIQAVKTVEILRRYAPKRIDLLSLDVEGMEDKVLKGMDFSEFEFNMIIVEIDKIKREKIRQLLPENYVELCHDQLNSVYLNSSW